MNPLTGERGATATGLRVDVVNPAVTVAAVRPVAIVLVVRNTGAVIERIACEIPGLDPAAYAASPISPTLFPGEDREIELTLRLPADHPSGFHEIGIVVHGRATGTAVETSVLVEVLPVVRPRLEVLPPVVTGGRRATYRLVATNDGNTDLDLVVRASERDQKLSFVCEPPGLRVPPGQSVEGKLRATGRRPWFGSPVVRSVTVTAEQPPYAVGADVVFRQKPRIPAGALTALTLALIVAVWAVAVLVGVRVAMAPERMTKTVPEGFAAGVLAADLDPATVGSDVGGVVTAATTGAPLARVTVELVDADGAVVARAATRDDGTYTLAGVLPGRYRVRFLAEGIEPRWYPGVTDAGAAGTVTVVAATPLDDLAVSVAGAPGSMAGTVLAGDDPAVPVTVTLEAVDLLDGTPFAPATQSTTAGGTYRFVGLPTPATYRIRVSAPGFTTQERQEVVRAGGDLAVNTVNLLAAAGTIAGSVVDAAGTPLGEVRVSTTIEGTETATVTPTAGQIGTFLLADLPTPGTYLVTVAKEGYASEVLAVRLGPGEQVGNVAVRLTSASGSLGGVVTGPDGNGLGGVRVAVIGGPGDLATTTFTSGQVGGYRLSGLPLPSSVTLAFSLPGYRTETLLVTVDRSAPDGVADVRLVPEVGRLTGRVLGGGGSGVGSATVTVSDGATSRSVLTATVPEAARGAFALDGLAPGTYTLRVAAPQYQDQAILVTVTAGGTAERVVTLRPAG